MAFKFVLTVLLTKQSDWKYVQKQIRRRLFFSHHGYHETFKLIFRDITV
jgi:hypothetical protein